MSAGGQTMARITSTLDKVQFPKNLKPYFLKIPWQNVEKVFSGDCSHRYTALQRRC